MLPREILDKVRRIEIRTRGLVNDIFSGEYHSVFKGRGMEFAEVREYVPGDDVRTIDWNVTARAGAPFVKVFAEERELTVMLMVDMSRSGSFGTRYRMKDEVAIEVCALLAFSAMKNNDKVGLIIFTDTVEKYVPPRKGKEHVMRVLRDLVYHEPERSGTDLKASLDFLLRVLKRRAVVFLVSDFMAEGFEQTLRVANSKHDVIAIRIHDALEDELPNVGLLSIEDAETGEIRVVDTSDYGIRKAYKERRLERSEYLGKIFRSMKLDYVSVLTGESFVDPLYSFFRERAKRFR